LRLALFLAALVATGPLPSARVVDGPRAEISIAWFRSDRISSLRSEHTSKTVSIPVVAGIGFRHRDSALPDTLLPHSLFQRPPPLQN
jgi:hypothetical protein